MERLNVSRKIRSPGTAWRLIFLCLALIAGSPARAADLQTEIIYSLRANELLPVITPLAGTDGSVSVYRDQLIIRATPQNLDLIRETLAKIDRPLKNLRISVRRQQQQSESQRDIGAQGKLRIENGNVSGRINAHADENQRQSSSNNSYSITASEGSSVLIATGSDVPWLTVINSNASGTVFGKQYVPVQSGMQVTPRLQPDGQVMLGISFRQAALANNQGVINSEATQTQIRTTLGQWTPLSQIESSISVTGSGLSSQHQQQARSSTPLEILVEEVP